MLRRNAEGDKAMVMEFRMSKCDSWDGGVKLSNGRGGRLDGVIDEQEASAMRFYDRLERE